MRERSKDKRRHRSRSSSRERRKEEGSSSRSSQKTSGSCVSSSKDTKRLQDKKKEKDVARSSMKEEKVVPVIKQETASFPITSKIEKECKNSQATTAEKLKEIKVEKEIKKEKQPSFDMFVDSPITKPIKKEETDAPAVVVVKGTGEGNEEDPIKTEPCKSVQTQTCKNIKTENCKYIKTEPCQMAIIKTEPSSPEVSLSPSVTSFSTLTTSVTEDSLEDTESQSHPVSVASPEQPDTVPVKQEVHILSDSDDDDFNVDMMLDNLDYVKSEHTEGIATSVKQEKDVDEEKNEPTVAGTKSKTPVKRVTWNIQEPEGPQPEKSASSKCFC